MERGGCVYILTNFENTVLYIGVTSELFFRTKEHRDKFYAKSFTAKYNLFKLIYFKQFSTIEEAIAEEKRLKNWRRQWKINLVNSFNPNWDDLFYEID
ncbi:MAG: GIY-YIG nuclease family protein [Pedobacter sp.]|nr:MAG: GIY-YIG nuclease family protein [Pedobacter sp.]